MNPEPFIPDDSPPPPPPRPRVPSRYEEESKDLAFGLGWGTVYAIVGTVVLVVCIVIGAMLWQSFERGINDRHTQNQRQTIQYVDSQVGLLRSYHADWQRLEAQGGAKGQQAAIVQQMRAIADKLDREDIPADIRAFLASH